MPNYILKFNDSTQHYFHILNQGLCVRTKPNNIWQNHKIIYPNSTDVFSVFHDKNNMIHAICITPENQIAYLKHKNNTWHSCIITKLNSDMTILNIMICETNVGLSILYTTKHMGTIFLIHCVLGNNAKPETLDKLASPEFHVFKKRVYYTNSDNILGYKDISDGKANNFNHLIPDGKMPYLITYNGKDMLTFKKNDSLYFQNRSVHKDTNAVNPLLTNNNHQLLLLWQSGDFIRYISSTDNGNSWSGVMQFVNPGKTAQIYNVVHDNKTQKYFGNHSSTTLNIYGKNDIFEYEQKTPPATNILTDSNQITKLKIMIELQKNEISKLKRELLELGEIIKTFPKIPLENNHSKSDNFQKE